MNNVKDIIRAAATAAFAGTNLRNYKTRVENNEIHSNMLGAEVASEPTKGVIVTALDGWYVQRVGRSLFVAHHESTLPGPLNIGDTVIIDHHGFAGTSKTEINYGSGTTITVGRRCLECPVNDEYLKDMTEQLSENKLEDGRRGMHLLHDLKMAGFRGYAHPESEANPYLEFEVDGAKFKGTVRFELVLGQDTYLLTFDGGHVLANGESEGRKTVYGELTGPGAEQVTFFDVLPLIEKHCDSSLSRIATVKVIARAKAPKAEASAA